MLLLVTPITQTSIPCRKISYKGSSRQEQDYLSRGDSYTIIKSSSIKYYQNVNHLCMMLFLYSDSLISQISQIFWENRIPSVHVRTTYDIENNTAHCQ